MKNIPTVKGLEIKLSKKSSDKILANMKRSGIKPISKRIREIRFHKAFEEGERLSICLGCGDLQIFLGVPDAFCPCKKTKLKVYSTKGGLFARGGLSDFISKANEVHSKIMDDDKLIKKIRKEEKEFMNRLEKLWSKKKKNGKKM